MTLIVLGVSHRSAPMRVLDQVALTPDEADLLAGDLVAAETVLEALVLATCNRVELYADVVRFHPAVAAITDLLAKATGVDRPVLLEHSYVHFDSAAVAHLFSVAAGLDSMVVGEPQILGQVRATLARAQEAGTAGRSLNATVQRALRAGKAVHSRTGIDRSGVSVVSVALDAAQAVVGDLSQRRILIVGAGSMGALAASTLSARRVPGVVVANRTLAAAERLSATLAGGRATDLDGVAQELADCDVAVFCTGAQDTLIDSELVATALQGATRHAPDHPLVVLDLALPHDTDPAVGDLPGVTRIDLAAIAAMPATAAAESDVRAARELVAEEVEAFLTSAASQQVEPTLVLLRAHAGAVLEAEMTRLRLRLSGANATVLTEVERAMRRVVATLLHNPTVRMKQLAAEPDGRRYAQALSALFDLDPSLPASVIDPTGVPPHPGPDPGVVHPTATGPMAGNPVAGDRGAGNAVAGTAVEGVPSAGNPVAGGPSAGTATASTATASTATASTATASTATAGPSAAPHPMAGGPMGADR